SATNNFDPTNVIGCGGFGKVYKGELSSPEGPKTVAFKHLDRRLGQGNVEFWKEEILENHRKREDLIGGLAPSEASTKNWHKPPLPALPPATSEAMVDISSEFRSSFQNWQKPPLLAILPATFEAMVDISSEFRSGVDISSEFRSGFQNWQKGDYLGSGSLGTVYEGFTESGFFFAMKEVSLTVLGSHGNQSIIQVEHEISLLSQLHHENIVRYLGTDMDDSKLYIFLELVTKGSLATTLINISSFKGTPYWLAPEVVDNRNFATDIWSLGCTVLELFTRKNPYSDLEGMQALFRIGMGEPPPIPDTLSVEARDFILECLQVNPDDRPTAAQLLEHPFLKKRTFMNSALASTDLNA
ncbi:hypothetical protein M8C21_027944, partial [Ambrosia artemisiifolia]